MGLKEHDASAIAELKDVWLERDPKNSTYIKITLTFGENPVIKNTKLVKEIKGTAMEDVYEVKSTPIEWKSKPAEDSDEEDEPESFLVQFEEDDVNEATEMLISQIWPSALDIFEAAAGELGSDSDGSEDIEESDVEEEQRPVKKGRKN
jgi:hypothetical protein